MSALSPAQKLGRNGRPARRRPLRTAGLLTAATALAFTTMTAGCLAPADAALSTVKARPSDSLTDSFGIKVETSQTQDLYKNHAKVMALLKQLGIRHIRTDFFAGNKFQDDYLNQLRSQLGITALLTMGRPNGTAGGPLNQLVHDAATKVPKAVFAMEGTNEWDRRGGKNWAAEVRAYQKKLWNAVKSNPTLRSKPLYGPTVGGDNHYAALGNVSAWEDYGNIHSYPGGRQPTFYLDVRQTRSAANRGAKPNIISETGYHDLIPTKAGHRPASDKAAAIYYPRMLLENIRNGIGHTFAFELLDNTVDPTWYRYHLGIVRHNWTKKPAFNALANILHLSADPGPAFATKSLAFGLSKAPGNLATQLYQKRDGTFILYLWRTGTSVYDPFTYKTQSVPKATFTVNLAKSSTVKVYRPTSSAAAQSTIKGNKVSVSLGAEVVALAIK